MLIAFTLAVMGVTAYVYFREGIFTAAAMLVNVVVAGLLTFNFFEPLAGGMGRLFRRTFLQGYEDFFALIALFCLFLGLLRALTNHFNSGLVEFPAAPQQFGAAVFALLAGYLTAGFLVCAMQTLPWDRHFLGFEPRAREESFLRRVAPPDRVWLALMHRAGTHAFGR